MEWVKFYRELQHLIAAGSWTDLDAQALHQPVVSGAQGGQVIFHCTGCSCFAAGLTDLGKVRFDELSDFMLVL